MKHYTMMNKPNFNDQQKVKVDLDFFGSDAGILEGKIVGRSMIHAIDMWMVEFPSHFPTYPFKVLNVPHTAIIDENTSIIDETEKI
jgi:hypothetical protein